MKVVILAGGFGTRLSEETSIRPKPMVELGGKPILWHVMKIYAQHGANDFIICCGYMGHVIKEYFANYSLHSSDVTFDLQKNEMQVHRKRTEPWKVTLVDTGAKTLTGGRLKRVKDYLDNEPFGFTYGDGVGDVDITKVKQFHKEQGGLVTMTAVQPPGRFGALKLSEQQTQVRSFREKPAGDESWINGGFFMVEPKALDYIEGDSSVWEREPLEHLAEDGKLFAYRHPGFWHPMDTLRDKNHLESLWETGKAPWRTWSD